MAKFSIVLDRRKQLKDGKFNLSILCVFPEGEISFHRSSFYIKIAALSLNAYKQIFIKRSDDEKCLEWRTLCKNYIDKCYQIYGSMTLFKMSDFRELLHQSMNEPTQEKESLPIKLCDLFTYYSENKPLKIKTKDHIRTTKNIFETFHEGILIDSVDIDFLNQFHNFKINEGCSIASISSHMRNLRSVINFAIQKEIVSNEYKYPFGKNRYSISNFFPRKLVLPDQEIISIVNFRDFETKQQEYARDIWLFLYRCNGINFADLLKMKWSDIRGNYIFITRQKTSSTRKNNIKPIIAPLNEKIKEVLEKISDKNSVFVLGELEEGFLESTFNNKSHKLRQEINQNLNFLTIKLNLSVPLKLATARDSYATTLLRRGRSTEEISEMLGHSNTVVTQHYLEGLTTEQTFKINEAVF